MPIDGSIIQEKELFFAEKLEILDFKGWGGLISGKKCGNNCTHILSLFSGFL